MMKRPPVFWRKRHVSKFPWDRPLEFIVLILIVLAPVLWIWLILGGLD